MTRKLNTDNAYIDTVDRRPAGNKVLPKAGVTGFYDTFVQGSTIVLRMNICAKNPPQRKAENR